MKKRILIVNEFSELATGFSTYMHYLLPRLYATGKYEIAELATYIDPNFPKIDNVPWQVYPNQPPEGHPAIPNYQSDKFNQFGRWRFEEVCLDFKPDIVVSIRDHWMDAWIAHSAYRRFFKWVSMPTVDGEPQKQEWIETYKELDGVLTYSEFGKSVLERQSKGKITVQEVAPAGADLDVFTPSEDKDKLRSEFGLKTDLMIFQTVMRNQPRKLFPDLMKAFVKYLELCKENGQDDLAARSFLYLHTTSPDVGWSIPEEIKRHKLSNKVLHTYMCEKCGAVYPSFYVGDKARCKRCGEFSARMPNTGQGVDRPILAKIMACADAYIQYSVCEGQGMPIVDAKSCGVPVFLVDYSAMSEQARNGGGIPIPVERFHQESINNTDQLRAFPDNQKCAEIMYNFATSSKTDRDKLSKEARKSAEKYYNWDNVSTKWQRVFDATETMDINTTWLSEPLIITNVEEPPANISNDQFIYHICEKVLRRPDLIKSVMFDNHIMSLQNGFTVRYDEQGRVFREPFGKQQMWQIALNMLDHSNKMEQIRANKIFGSKERSPNEIGYSLV